MQVEEQTEKAVEKVDRLTYTVPETARALGVSERSVYNRIYDGTLTRIRIGRRVMVSAAELRAITGGA